jgi:hypothetical protein
MYLVQSDLPWYNVLRQLDRTLSVHRFFHWAFHLSAKLYNQKLYAQRYEIFIFYIQKINWRSKKYVFASCQTSNYNTSISIKS